METLQRILAEHPFFQGLADDHLALITGCAKNARFVAGTLIFKEGDPADTFYLIRHGGVLLELDHPGRDPLVIDSLKEGQVLGASWLFPPYRWMFDAHARTLVRALAIDGKCLRTKCDAMPELGYELMKRFSQEFVSRLHHSRLQLLDMYGTRNND